MRTTTGYSDANSGEPIAEAQLLIACLRGSPLELPIDTDWHALLTLAEVHSVLPFVYRALAGNSVKMPEFFLNAIQESKAFTEILAAELEHLLTSFAQKKIEVIPLKGPVIAEILYGDATARPCSDLDLLVRTGDFNRAERLLMETGWIASTPADEYQRSFVRDSIVVELHFGVASPRAFPFDLNGTWNRTRNGAFRGQPLKMMSETDCALYLLLHGLKHGYGKLIWILDSARALEMVVGCSPREFVERARAQGLQQVLYVGCAMVFEVLPKRLPESLLAVLAESPGAMQAARATVKKLLAGEAGNGRGPEIWGFYLQTETEAAKRWRRRLTFFIPTNEDYRWTASHRIPRSFTPLLRPFRLLAKHGLRQVWRTAFPPSI